jgi:hypothetical protein
MPAPDADFLRRLEAVSAATEAVLKSSLAEAPLAGEIAAMRYATESGRARLCSPPRQDS